MSRKKKTYPFAHNFTKFVNYNYLFYLKMYFLLMDALLNFHTIAWRWNKHNFSNTSILKNIYTKKYKTYPPYSLFSYIRISQNV